MLMYGGTPPRGPSSRATTEPMDGYRSFTGTLVFAPSAKAAFTPVST